MPADPVARKRGGLDAGLGSFVRDSLSDQIYLHMRGLLMSGAFEPGQRIVIRKVAAAFETSHTPVREAVMQLVREGALEFRSGHSLCVPDLSMEQYAGIREVRANLERLAASKAAARASASLVETLEHIHARFVQAEDEACWKDALAANQQFHFAIYEACGSDILLRLIEGLWLLAGPFINHRYPASRPVYEGLHPHAGVIEALRQGNDEEAGEWIVRDMHLGSDRAS
ncbi:MAG: GntR family transcriptional regulator [Methylobacterium mesophilicum]|nr:GntR family transcriptional regulator [Methylobacterium mesophilicum]